MLQHYIKFAIRNFRSNKVIFSGSLATLCLGALCISFLFSYVLNELTMDDFHKRKDDIYMMIIKEFPKSQWKPSSNNFNVDEYPEIDNKVILKKYSKGELKVVYENMAFTPKVIIADTVFFRVFDFKLNIGNRETILLNTNTAIISKHYAELIFGDQNPIGKTIKVISRYEKVYTIEGVVEVPPNSSITFDFILPDSSVYNRMKTVFIVANKNFDRDVFTKKIKNIGNNIKHTYPGYTESTTTIRSLNELYFKNDLVNKGLSISSHSGNKKNIYVLLVIMLVVLIISGLNFSNLQILNINKSIKNIEINKIQGAQKQHIIFQKCIEVCVLIILSVVVITILYKFLLPHFNNLINLSFTPPLWKVIIINGCILVLFAVLALVYPLITILKVPIITSIVKKTVKGNQLFERQIIAVVQYTLTCILIISSIIVTKQLKLMLNKDLGFNSKNIVTTKIFHNRVHGYNKKEQQATYQRGKNELESHTSIKSFAQGRSPLDVFQQSMKTKEGDDEYSTHNILLVTPNYNTVLGLKLLEGRFFEKDKDKERGNKIVINEAAKKYWNIKDISQTRLLNKSWSNTEGYEIIGVVKDFNYEHLSIKNQPLMMLYFEDVDNDFLIQFEEEKVHEGLQFLEVLFNKINPGESFEYSFLSNKIASLYQKEKRLSSIYIVFTIIALLISAIGLFTIALYDTQRRVKEIGVRKVNGATIKEIMLMLNKDFIKWVLIAFVIACPIAYYAMSKWLENFAYKTNLSWWVFVLAGLFTLVIALLTVSWQSYRAATRNPVESLRDE